MDMNKLKEQFQAITKYEIGSAKKDDWDGIVPIDVEGLWNWIESKLAEYEKQQIDVANTLAMDCLQSTRYQTDANFRAKVDDVLTIDKEKP